MQSAWNERGRRIGGVAIAAVLVGGLTSGARAQTYDVNTPLSVRAAGNADRLRILPVVTTVYDSNTLRTNDQRSMAPRDNIRVSPGFSIGLTRTLGRTRFGVDGTIAYDFNTRFKQLDRERINLIASVTTPVGSPCNVSASAAFERAQFDLGNTDALVAATSQRQTYDLSATCNRSAGFFPLVGVNYSAVSNSKRNELDSNQITGRAGVGYSRPTLGTVQLIGSVSKISRPKIKELLGIDDSTTITFAEILFTRAVAPRVSFQIGFGITHANPTRADVVSFTGPSFDSSVTIRPVPRFTVIASAQRFVQNQSGYSATYVVVANYRVAASYQLSARSTASVFAQRLQRDPRGQDLLLLAQPRGKDRNNQIGAGYSFDLRKSLRLNLSLTHISSTADNAFYDYTANSASAGISANF